MKVIEIKENEFIEKIENSKTKVLIDCYASWCGPCKMLMPILDEIANENDTCEFYKINIEEAEKIANMYNIMSIPTLLLFENNELKEKIVGFKTKEEIESLISS